MRDLVDAQGRSLRLGDKLGEGGEGAVFRLAGRQGLAVKLYAAPLTAERARKIQVLASLAAPDLEHFTAWPAGLVRDTRGQARGLLLPVVEQAKDIHNLYGPSSRKRHFPDADWRFLVHVAANLSRAFGAVHAKGLVIGDVNQGSVLVAGDGTVRLIDVDSFQVPVPGAPPLLCTVAVPFYLPPELYRVPLSTVVRTPHHDAFGLAVLLFQLLLQGRHPYAGVYSGPGDMPIEKAIPEHRFAYGSGGSARQITPPPNTVGLEILPGYVAQKFEFAFSADAPKLGRPTAAQWVGVLEQLASELVKCRRNRTHQHATSLSGCPWCGLEAKTGTFPFGVPAVGVATSAASGEHAQLAALIAAVRPPVAGRAVSAPPATAVAAAQAAAGVPPSSVVLSGLGLLVAGGGLFVLPGGWVLVLLGVVLLLSGGSARERRRAPWVTAYRAAKKEHEEAISALETANQFVAFRQAKEQVARAKRDWEGIPRLRADKYRELERHKREEQLHQFLQSKLVESARIQGIGPARVATLTAYGIDTAADIEHWRIMQIPTFGDVLASRLVAWRQDMERRFVFDPSRPVPPQAVARVEKELEDVRRRTLESLRQGARALADASMSAGRAAQSAADRVSNASRRLEQAQADVLAATGHVPA